jgi:hypothetical protein
MQAEQQQQQQRSTSLEHLQNPAHASENPTLANATSNEQIVNDILTEINTENNGNSASFQHQVDPHTQQPMPPHTDEQVDILQQQSDDMNALHTQQPDVSEVDVSNMQQQQISTDPAGTSSTVLPTHFSVAQFDVIMVVKNVLLFMIMFVLFSLPEVHHLFCKLPFFCNKATQSVNMWGTMGCALCAGLMFAGVKLYVG